MRYTVPQVIADAFPSPATLVVPARVVIGPLDSLVLEVFVAGAWSPLVDVDSDGGIARRAALPPGFSRRVEP